MIYLGTLTANATAVTNETTAVPFVIPMGINYLTFQPGAVFTSVSVSIGAVGAGAPASETTMLLLGAVGNIVEIRLAMSPCTVAMRAVGAGASAVKVFGV